MSRRSRPVPRPAERAQARTDRGSEPKSTAAAGSGAFAALRRTLREKREAEQAPPSPPPTGKSSPPQTRHDADRSDTEALKHADSPRPAGQQTGHDSELALFRELVGPSTPIRSHGRVEIERPRPAPVPRPRQPIDEDMEQTSAHKGSTDPLSAAYDGVVPLRDTGRIDPSTPRRHLASARTSSRAAPAQRPDALVLPAETELADSAELFRAVVGELRPIDTRNRIELARPAPQPSPIKREEDERAALSESLVAPLTLEDRIDMGEEAAFLRPGLPRRILTDLRRGRWVLQGQVDLHGLIRDEARAALAHFLHDSLLQGRRCIRVIHGKGHGSPGKISILKQLSRGWLAQREEILAFCQAGPHDGGGGALLVLLRAQNASQRSAQR